VKEKKLSQYITNSESWSVEKKKMFSYVLSQQELTSHYQSGNRGGWW